LIILYLTALFLLVFGVGYAWWEYDRPIYPTRLAVAVGVGVTMIGQVVMTVTAYSLECEVLGVAAGVVVPFVLTGVPMYVAQEIKEQHFANEGNHRRGSTDDLGKLGDDDTA